MNNEKEISAVQLSATKKDFYQIWAELIETASKISSRWNPEATNESDPGIVLLKVLTAIADKLNYSIDTNILEAYMPSASQEESMRKLCDMLGYSMKYYQSATTTVTVAYKGDEDISEKTITICKGTNIKNTDGDVNYVLLDDIVLGNDTLSGEGLCIEGELVNCTSNDDDIIAIDQLDDNQRYYLPEKQIAENGIFIRNYNNGIASELWTKVNNLNTQIVGSRVYKFGYDSKNGTPYVQFPEDISTIIEDGLKIKFIRTSGVSGNISANTLNTLSTIVKPDDVSSNDEQFYEAELYTVTNASAAMNGTNAESLNDAYTNYKKTIGTFDTLTTCRDYMNKIYQLMSGENSSTPVVSNVIVSDIRDDINRAHTLCSFNEYGICYTDQSNPVQNDISDKTISHFDLMLYPFHTVSGLNTKLEFKNSFKIDAITRGSIEAGIVDYKTISHKINIPDDDEVACIKNYLKLNAKITTTARVNAIEEANILANIYSAIYKNFNMRKLDFGEELPFDTILEVIENADSRIKNVSLDEPIIYTRFLTKDGNEYDTVDNEKLNGKIISNKLALRNILAGRLPLFNYDETFKPEFTEKKHNKYDTIYPADDKQLVKMTSEFKLPLGEEKESGTLEYDVERTLKANEAIHFRLPNLKTLLTYPAYVNYFIHLDSTGLESGDFKCIRANEDYRLQAKEWLAINYTNSTTDEDGNTTKSVINILYKEGTIIKPNFDLFGSAEVRRYKGTSYAKTSGYDFSKYQKTTTDIPGMYSLGTSEQIELRDIVTVELNDTLTYIYWERKDEDLFTDTNGKIRFNFDEDNGTAYTLKDGEYLYYTDSAKNDIAYYGNGTKIIRSRFTPDLVKQKTDETLTADEIATKGLSAAIPWLPYDFSGDNKALVLEEYQYITLSENDKLKTITLDNKTDSLTNKWIKCKAASYILSEKDDSLPPVNIGGDISWEVRTRLGFNMSPTITQTLYADDSITLWDKDGIKIITLEGDKDNPVSLKSNYVCQANTDEVDTHIKKYDTDGTLIKEINDFKVKVFKKEDLLVNGIGLNLNNFGNYWTKITFDSIAEESGGPATKLNIIVPEEDNALVMFYYLKNRTIEESGQALGEHNAYIKLTNDTESGIKPVIFNNNNDWWDGVQPPYPGFDGYCFREGLNIVQIKKSCTLEIYSDSRHNDTLTFGGIDLIYKNEDKQLNPRIKYFAIDSSAGGYELRQLLADINKLDSDHNFYYNNIMDNSLAIDFNINVDANSEDAETLATPTIWYDYNNINNKFVISEIDADYLSTGITLTRSSRK